MNQDKFEAEVARIDEEFRARVQGGRLSPTDSKQYWQRLTEVRRKREQQVVETGVRQAVDNHFRINGCYVKDLGRGLFWLRPPVQKGLDFQHLMTLDAKLPAGRRLRTIRAHQGGFMLVIG